ncbi:Re/Si-specific NAD(P)(+) transhydrogenase subunit alpha [Nitratireductor mangrovi]|uniref:proton-translocating NAD(P)(+) transhydrogenase n=1 Tax=Nitratireductor mangrovi TaxID=2599600 RepID=A0A5B8L028_9HYPH|nr:Re/Si-specific NAD(P)(+) transhydrogenase subunit alpha [Nitratireductor mangrovi]QDZ01367.1 Re/Si-specific NAD(P)(+) transhydrogenase subunit alpha [Nitratireductor mangrovi]
MGQTIFVPSESDATEGRVAASPETVKRFAGLGFDVIVEKGAGSASRIPDADFASAGATIGKASDISKADIVLKVRRPSPSELKSYRKGAAVFAAMDPYGNEAEIAAMGKAGVSAFAMEFMPRITRAQSMDVLSSQANLAGYRAVIDAAAEYDRALPMMMTAAGTVPAAKVFVMGAGVAGLQAIATARRLGAVVTATDVRAAAGEQVASLGAKFIMTDALKDASGEGGYARELTDAEKKAQAELVADHIAKQDIVITTALIPGRPAPRLVSAEMVKSMRAGSVIVDLAVERGGNVEGAVAGKIVTTANDVKIVGHLNVPGRVASSASLLYAKNLYAFIETMVDKEKKSFAIDREDELVKATLLTHDGAVVHANFADAAAAAPAAKKPAAKAPAAPRARKSAAAKPAAKRTAAKKPASGAKPEGDA